MNTDSERTYWAELRQVLVDRFSESELKDLCFDLGIDYETLEGENKLDKARELVLFCKRHDRTPELVTAVRVSRRGISWGQTPSKNVELTRKVFSSVEGSVGANPYFNRRAIRAPKDFYGRSYEVRTALTLLASLQCLSVVGPRRIGKSSLLYHISEPAVLEDHGIDAGKFAFIFLSCEQLSDLSQDQVLQVMLNQARAAMVKAGFQFDPGASPTAGMTFFDFSHALAGFTQLGRKLVFLLDEFECLAQNSSLTPAFFAGLRSIPNSWDVAYVTASGRSLLDLTYADRSVLGSPFFNIFTTIQLPLFKDEDARDLIYGPSRAAEVHFSDATAKFILSLTDHHPFFIQIACFHAFDIQSQKETLTEADYQLIQERARDGLQDHLKVTWGYLKPEEKRFLSSLEIAQDDPRYNPTLQSLLKQGVICQRDNRYRLCALWAEFVRSQPAEASDREPRSDHEASPVVPQ
jgi:hypothetical protein